MISIPAPRNERRALAALFPRTIGCASRLRCHGYVPFGYAADQVLGKAVEGTKSTDRNNRLADYIHSHRGQPFTSSRTSCPTISSNSARAVSK